jgi:hypothetical protein
MKQLTPEDKKKLLSDAFWDKNVDENHWDKNVDENQLYDFIIGKTETLPFLDKKLIFCRLLSTYDWYTLNKLIPKKLLKEALTDDVLDRLYPKELKGKYKYARGILFK